MIVILSVKFMQVLTDFSSTQWLLAVLLLHLTPEHLNYLITIF